MRLNGQVEQGIELSMLRQGIRWLLVITSLAVGGLISLKHPLGGAIALVCFAGTVAAAFWRPTISLTVLLALIPVIGFAPWSGWLTFEELDLVVLAFAAGGYARWAMSSRMAEAWRWPRPALLLAILMACALLISMVRGFSDAGGFVFGFDQGYDGPMNSLRIAKSFFLALLVTPLLAWLAENREEKAATRLAFGLALGVRYCFARRALGTSGIHRAAEFLVGLPFDSAVLGNACRRRGARRLAAPDSTVRSLGLAERCNTRNQGSRGGPGVPRWLCGADDLFAGDLSCPGGRDTVPDLAAGRSGFVKAPRQGPMASIGVSGNGSWR